SAHPDSSLSGAHIRRHPGSQHHNVTESCRGSKRTAVQDSRRARQGDQTLNTADDIRENSPPDRMLLWTSPWINSHLAGNLALERHMQIKLDHPRPLSASRDQEVRIVPINELR